MTDKAFSNLEKFGVSFRFLTPVLIAVVGYFTVQTLNSIDNKFEKIDMKFETFIASYHEMDKRVDRLEQKTGKWTGKSY